MCKDLRKKIQTQSMNAGNIYQGKGEKKNKMEYLGPKSKIF